MNAWHYLPDWQVASALLSGVLGLPAGFFYARDMLRGGTTKPNAITFVLWTLCQAIALTAQLRSGASWSIVVVITATVNTGGIACLALAGYGYRRYGWLDAWCGVSSLVAIVLWQETGDPMLAIAFAIIADVFASAPTVKKVISEPETEHVGGWTLIVLSTAFAIISTTKWDLPNLVFPTYLLLMNFLILVFAYFGRPKRRQY